MILNQKPLSAGRYFRALLPFLILAFSIFSPFYGHAENLKSTTYPGTITLQVDLSEAARKIITIKESIPVQAGHVKLFYPKWIPGEHAPTGTIEGISGLRISGNGQRISWRRDLEDMFTLHVQVPPGVKQLDLNFDVLSPINDGDFGATVSMTPRLAMLEWNQVLFYPADFASDKIAFSASLALPSHWKMASALPTTTLKTEGKKTVYNFHTASLTEMIDSPVMAGQYFRRIALTKDDNAPVFLSLVADREENLHMTEAQIKQHQFLVQQASTLFGTKHYQRYEFLQVLSDRIKADGLEHHQSSNNRSPAEFYLSPELYLADPSLLPHEFVHSWNGKFRRPVGLATTHYNLPMKSDLLWAYEGLTNYLGEVLSARAGMWTAEQYRDALACTAAEMDHRPGRAWRPLRDTADHAQTMYHLPSAWANYRRGTDFYKEGSLLWLDIDTQLRVLSQGKKSIDDFVKVFHGDDAKLMKSATLVKPYNIDEIIKTLNSIQTFDWTTFLNTRIESTDERAPLDGIIKAGWTLVYNDTPTDLFKAIQKSNRENNLMYSLGLQVIRERSPGSELGEVTDVLWNGPAFNAGLTPGVKIISVDGESYDGENLNSAVSRAQKDHQPIELVISNHDYVSTIRINYNGGHKYPRLVAIEGKADLLGAITLAH